VLHAAAKTLGHETLAPLNSKVFAVIWASTFLSNVSVTVLAVGAVWHIATIDGKADVVALVQAVTLFPIFLLGLVAGGLADILDRRRLVITAQLVMATSSAGLALGLWLGVLSPSLVFALIFLLGCGAAFRLPAYQASIGTFVPKEQIAAAVSLINMQFSVSRALGPVVGGILVEAFGAQGAFVGALALNLCALGTLTIWPAGHAAIHKTLSDVADSITAGLRYVAGSTSVVALLSDTALICFMGSALWALLPVIVKDVFRGSAFDYGISLAFLGAGAVIGTIVVVRLQALFERGRLLAATCMVCGLSSFFVPLTSDERARWLVLALAGAAWMAGLSVLVTTAQTCCPTELRGRVVATYYMIYHAGLAAGSWFWGVFAKDLGIAEATEFAGISLIVVGVIIRARAQRGGTDNVDTGVAAGG